MHLGSIIGIITTLPEEQKRPQIPSRGHKSAWEHFVNLTYQYSEARPIKLPLQATLCTIKRVTCMISGRPKPMSSKTSCLCVYDMFREGKRFIMKAYCWLGDTESLKHIMCITHQCCWECATAHSPYNHPFDALNLFGRGFCVVWLQTQKQLTNPANKSKVHKHNWESSWSYFSNLENRPSSTLVVKLTGT